MRQIALAQQLLNQHHEVTLFASITGPAWLKSYVLQVGRLEWVQVKENDFSINPYVARQFDSLIVDSYQLDQESLEMFESVIPTVAVVIDGPWQNLRGKLAISPILKSEPPWLNDYRERFLEFHHGPRFLFLRKEVLDCSEKRLKRVPNSKPLIVVALGGSDVAGKSIQIAENLAREVPSAEIVAFVQESPHPTQAQVGVLDRVSFLPSGTGFLDYVSGADLVVVGAGSTVGEMLFLGVPTIFVAVAENQMENVEFLEESNLGGRAVVKSFENPNDLGPRSRRILALSGQVAEKPIPDSTLKIIDGKGAERVARILTR
jgi:spore coat polysaccharide biosynthesis predicted glycosyltransferase SpsG